ncbi:MAG: hypothetical protein ACTSUO_05785 [Candidatus Thorarchaeota archaeon]
MKNLLGGIISSIIGSVLVVNLLQSVPIEYPEPFNAIWILLVGCTTLSNSLSGFTDVNVAFALLSTWILIGIVSGFFSESKWNSIRTAVWLGICIATISIIEINLMDSGFWGSEARNLTMLLHYISIIVFSMISLVGSVPVTLIITKLRKETDAPIPKEIITTCECGAVFKSIPLICSECGNSLTKD